MDVGVSALRMDLSQWLDRVRDGAEIVITERGTPVARLVPVTRSALLDELTRTGAIAAPERASRIPARGTHRLVAGGPVAELVSAQRG